MPPVHTCPECGNHDMRVQVVDGAALYVCGLCGAGFGVRRAVEAMTTADDAGSAGIAPGVWPLVRVLARLPGLSVRASGEGHAPTAMLPHVELAATSPAALVQLENVVKSLRLAATTLRRPWAVELAYEQSLVFVLRPAGASGRATAAEVREARRDIEVLARALERDMRLSWWRDGDGAPSG